MKFYTSTSKIGKKELKKIKNRNSFRKALIKKAYSHPDTRTVHSSQFSLG